MRRRLRQLRSDQRGAVAVIIGLLMVVLLGSAATVLDLARLRHERHMIQAAVDLGSLAGAQFLPVYNPPTASAAQNQARAIAVANYPGLGVRRAEDRFRLRGHDVRERRRPDERRLRARRGDRDVWGRMDRAGRQGVPSV